MMQRNGSRQYSHEGLLSSTIFFSVYFILFLGILILGNKSAYALPVLVTLAAVYIGSLSLNLLLAAFICVLPIQPFLTMPLSSGINTLGLKLFVSTKEILIFVLFLFLATELKTLIKKLTLIDLSFMCLGLTYTYGLLFSPINFPTIVSFREGIMIILPYIIGRLYILKLGPTVVSNFVATLSAVAVFVSLFGLIERFILGNEFWKIWGALNYIDIKFSEGGVVVKSIDGVPQNWYTYVGNNAVRRVTSTIGDATAFSRFVASALIVFTYYYGFAKIATTTKLFAFSIMTIATALSMGRGGILLLIIALSYYPLYRKNIFLSVALMGLAAFLLTFSDLFSIDSANSIRHISGLVSGLNAAIENPAGNGLGSSGQVAVLYTNDYSEKVSESFLGSISYQLGIPGIAAFFLLSIGLPFKLYIMMYRSKIQLHKQLLASGLVSMIGIFSTSILSNSAISPISSSILFIWLGIVISITDSKHPKQHLNSHYI